MKWHIDKTKLFLHDVLVHKKTKYYELYYLNSQRHNPNGPAYLEWYENGQLKREEYWLNGQQLTEKQYLARLGTKRTKDNE